MTKEITKEIKMKQKWLHGMSKWSTVKKSDKNEQLDWAVTNSINASVGRNPTYSPKASMLERQEFRAAWKLALQQSGERYTRTVSENAHVKRIQTIADSMSQKHGKTLQRRKLRFGTSQKALNLYLKYLWCLEEIPCPPHCPVDSIVLRAVGNYEAWTKLKSATIYMKWIADCRQTANDDPQISKHKKSERLSWWELKVWEEGR